MPSFLLFSVRFEPLQGVFSYRLQHPEATLAVLRLRPVQEALVHERRQKVEYLLRKVFPLVAHRLRRFERTATREDREPPEEQPLFRSQQIVAPPDGVPEGLLAGRRILRPTFEQAQPALEPFEDRPRREQPEAGRRE